MQKYKLKFPRHLLQVKGGYKPTEEEIVYCKNYKEKLQSLSQDKTVFYATPQQVITELSSNHSKRIIQPDCILRLIQETDGKIEHAYSINTYRPNDEIQILLAGDSHSEFFSRIPWNSTTDWSHACLWTGATTCLGFATDSSSVGMIISTLKKLDKYGEKRFILLLSLGEIDIRHLFYSMVKVRKLFKGPCDYIDFIKPQLEKKIRLLKSLESIIDIGILQPTPTTNLRKYGTPESTDDLKEYYLKMGEHPVLGTPEFRIECWEKMSTFMDDFCNQNNIAYIKRSKESFTESNLLNPKHSHDGCHLSSKEMLEFQYSILQQVSNVKKLG
jgi:hypothetical protein